VTVINPKQYTAKVLIKEAVSSKVTKLTLQYLVPDSMEFIPGQFVNIKCADTAFRAYSIASDYKDSKKLSLLIETGHDGLGSNYVKTLKTNDEVVFIGPSGKLSLCEPLPEKLYFYATGTGLAPFLAMFYRLIDLSYMGEVRVYVGFRREGEAFETELLKHFSNSLKSFEVKIYYSQPENISVPNIGYITQEIDNNMPTEARYYICGHPTMVKDVKEKLVLRGVPEGSIIIEGFTKHVTN